MVAGTENGIVMVEAGGSGVAKTRSWSHRIRPECCRKITAGIRELVGAKPASRSARITPAAIDQELYDEDRGKVRAELTDAMDTQKYRKLESYHRIARNQDEAARKVSDEEQRSEAQEALRSV